MHTKCVVPIYNELLLGHKKEEWNKVIGSNMDTENDHTLNEVIQAEREKEPKVHLKVQWKK